MSGADALATQATLIEWHAQIYKIGGKLMANNDEDKTPAETPDEIRGRRQVGWSRAAMDLSPQLEWLGAGKRLVRLDDVGKTVWELISEMMEERYSEIERGE